MRIYQPDRVLLRQFMARCAERCSGDVVDVGGGTGRYASLFRSARSYRRVDIDSSCSPEILASIEAIPLPDASVDVVLCNQVLGDVWNLLAARTELLRILRPGGLLLVTESLHAEEHDLPNDYWRFTSEAWKKLWGEHCDILTIETRGGYRCLRTQQHIRRCIVRFHLYQHRFFGGLFHLYASVIGRWAIWRDAHDHSALNASFTLGHNLLLRKR